MSSRRVPSAVVPARMASQMTPIFARLTELLADGEWHDREPLIRELMKMVPPGEAWRQAEKVRVRQRLSRARQRLSPAEFEAWLADGAKPEYEKSMTMEDQIRVGQRTIVNQVVVARKTNRLETRTVNGKRQLRIRPLHPFYTEARAAKLRAKWIEIMGGEPKTDEDTHAMNRWVNTQMSRDRAGRGFIPPVKKKKK